MVFDVKIYDLKDSADITKYKVKDLWDMDFEVTWERIEQIVRMTNMSNYEAVMRVYDVLKKQWILKKIEHILNTKYEQEMKMRYFVWDDEKDIIPKVYIAGKSFPLDQVLFD